MSTGNDYTDPSEEESVHPREPEPADEPEAENPIPSGADGPDSENVKGEAEAENAKETGGYGY